MGKTPSEEISAEVPTKEQKRDLKEAGKILEGWLQSKISNAKDLGVINVEMPIGAGVANETLLVDTQQIIDGATVDVPYVIRVDTDEHLFMGMDLKVHYQMYEVLGRESDIPVPTVLGFEEDSSLLGERFFLMERIEGRVPPDNPPFHHGGWVTELTTEERHAIWRNTVEVMAKFCTVDVSKFPFLNRPQFGKSGLEQELRHWINYTSWCGSDSNETIQAGGKWLVDNFPDNPPTELSWGDSRAPNIIFQGTEVAAVLDWDMVSLAGAECDLAWYQIMDQPHTVCRGLSRLAGFGTPQDVVDLWEEITGRKAQNLHWHAVFNAFRLASIMIRLPTMLKKQGRLPPESEYLFTNNTGIQWLCSLLDLPPVGEPTTPWVGWDK